MGSSDAASLLMLGRSNTKQTVLHCAWAVCEVSGLCVNADANFHGHVCESRVCQFCVHAIAICQPLPLEDLALRVGHSTGHLMSQPPERALLSTGLHEAVYSLRNACC